MFIRHYGNRIRVRTPAKINLFLELQGKRPDGFHEIDTLMQAVSLWDDLTVATVQTDNFRVSLAVELHGVLGRPQEQDFIPDDDRNLVVRACRRLHEYAFKKGIADRLPSLDLRLVKRIPSAAGLGGASSNCAAALVAANRLWGLNLPQATLVQLAAELGSDVPFFLSGGAARCQGRGEIIRPVACRAGLDIVIAKPTVALPTGKVFAQVQPRDEERSIASVVTAVAAGQSVAIANAMFNRLQLAAEQLTDQIDRLAYWFDRTNCLGHQVSGSGSSYFGVFSNRKSAATAGRLLSNWLPDCRLFRVATLQPNTLLFDHPNVLTPDNLPPRECMA